MTETKNFTVLTKWVQPQHFEPCMLDPLKSVSKAALEAGIFIDDFLKEEQLVHLQLALREDAEFDTWCRLKNKDGPVTEEEYFACEETQRFMHFKKLIGAKPEHCMSPNWLRFIKFQMDYSSDMVTFLEHIIDAPLAVQESVTHTFYQDSSLNIHSDHAKGRRICTVLSLSDEWEPRHGAELVMLRNEGGRKEEINRIAHKTNRLVIFSVNKDIYHYVDVFADIATTKLRRSNVYWFKDKT